VRLERKVKTAGRFPNRRNCSKSPGPAILASSLFIRGQLPRDNVSLPVNAPFFRMDQIDRGFLSVGRSEGDLVSDACYVICPKSLTFVQWDEKVHAKYTGSERVPLKTEPNVVELQPVCIHSPYKIHCRRE